MLWLTSLALGGEPDPYMTGCDTNDRALVAAYNDAVEAFNAGNMKGTRSAMDKVLKRSPACKGALVLGITARMRLSDGDALPMAARAISAYPDDPDFHLLLAELAFVAQAFDASLDASLKARALDPNHAGAARQAFRSYMRLGRYDEATALAAAYPGFDEGGRDCLRIEILVDQDREAEAEALRTSCAASTADIADDVIATLNAHTGDKNAVLGQAADLGVSSHALSALAMKRFDEGQYAEARDLFERALELEPWNAFIQVNLAMAYIHTGQNVKAKQALQALYGADAWVTQWQTGAISGVITKGAERDLEESLKFAFAELVTLLVDEGDTEEAAVALRKAEARFGRVGPLAAPSVRYARATGGAKAGWEAMERALAAFPGEPELVHEAGRMAFADGPGVPRAVAEAIVSRGELADHQNLVGGYANAKMFADCSRVGLSILPAPGVDSPIPGLVYGCALAARDLATADTVVRGRHGSLDANDRVYHGFLLLDAGRPADALALVKAVETAAEHRDDVIVGSHRKLGQLDEALLAAKGATLDPSTRYNLGVDLYNVKRVTDAAEVMRGFDCSALPEMAKDCAAFLEATAR